MKTDIEIAREISLHPIQEIAQRLGLPQQWLEPYGRYKAKVPLRAIDPEKEGRSNLILVTAITPTKAGIGKTTTSIGLALGLQQLGRNAVLALREPSLGPCFGMKGGATGGGYAQVLPMEDINLHFTGDFHAITSANNMIAALLDNYLYQNRSRVQLKEVRWKRVLDVNDRSLRNIVTGLGGTANGIPQETGFDITPASEIMAILCLASGLEDLRHRIENILLGYTAENQPLFVRDLGIAGSIVALLKDAVQPNLVQTTEGSAAFIHGGPFANIAHGCNSLFATRMAMSYGDYVITEAGFGADLGAEKFLNIKCRVGGLQPKASVLVVTSQALKLHGQVPLGGISKPDSEGLKRGFANLERHLENLQAFGQSVVVAFNRYGFDSDEEIEMLRSWCLERGARFAVNDSYAQGGPGATDLAQTLLDIVHNHPSLPLRHTYELTDPIELKLQKVVQQVYRGRAAHLSKKARTSLARIEKLGLGHLPVCIAKTQYSFSDDPNQLGVATDFDLHVEDLVLNAGAGFVVAVAGDIMRMPGLPKEPQALAIDVADGFITGLS